MEQAKALVEKILSNEVSGFFFVVACAIGVVTAIAGAFWVTFQAVIYIGAY